MPRIHTYNRRKTTALLISGYLQLAIYKLASYNVTHLHFCNCCPNATRSKQITLPS
uniref:Uncharacterized protein n=1 Tax=Anguilla anguilla TaxID=7936 RepID=A0A0E9TCG3_ANGAN